jgi:hypothetical protein
MCRDSVQCTLKQTSHIERNQHSGQKSDLDDSKAVALYLTDVNRPRIVLGIHCTLHGKLHAKEKQAIGRWLEQARPYIPKKPASQTETNHLILIQV